LLQVGIGGCVLLRLLEDQFVGLAEAGAESVVYKIDDCGELDFRRLLAARSDFGRPLKFSSAAPLEGDAALTDFLQAVILELNVLAEVVDRTTAFRQATISFGNCASLSSGSRNLSSLLFPMAIATFRRNPAYLAR